MWSWLFVVTAHGTSALPGFPADLAVHIADPLPTTGSIYLQATGNGWSLSELEDMASEVRLRGPKGARIDVEVHQLGAYLRLTPVESLKPGRYGLERRFAYADGDLLLVPERRVVPADRHGWFLVEEFKVVKPQGQGPADFVSKAHVPSKLAVEIGELFPIPGRWGASLAGAFNIDLGYELELQDVGAIAWFPAGTQWPETASVAEPAPPGTTWSVLSVTGQETDDPWPSIRGADNLRLDRREPLSVRVVAVDGAGRRGEGPWVELPALKPEWPHIHAPTPVTWRAVEVERDDTPTWTEQTRCGNLVVETTRPAPDGRQHVVDAKGHLHVYDWGEDPVVVDEAPWAVPGVELGPHSPLLWMDDTLVVGNLTGTRWSAVENGKVVWEVETPQFMRPNLSAESQFQLGGKDEHGAYWLRTYVEGVEIAAEELKSHPRAIFPPALVARGATEGSREDHRRWTFFRFVQDGDLHVAGLEDGTLRWTRPVDGPPQPIGYVVADRLGVDVRVVDEGVARWHYLDHNGEAAPAREPFREWMDKRVVRKPGEDAVRVPFGGGQAVMFNGAVMVEQGRRRTAPVAISGTPTADIVVTDDTLVVHAVDWNQGLVRHELRCDGRPMRGPLWWLDPDQHP